MSERPPSGPDDLAPWADDDLVRALRAPGTTAELADQDRYVAAFREAGPAEVRSLPRRAASRLGAGGTAVIATVALTTGVAAAYTGTLPDPIQRAAHSLHVGMPAPGAGRPQAGEGHTGQGGAASRGPGTTTSTGPSTAPTGGPTTAPADGPTTGVTRGAPSAGPSQGPSGSPTTEPTGGATTPVSSGGGGAASAMSMSAPLHRVGVGQTTTLSGLATDATGAPLPGHLVVLQVRGPRHWRPVEQVTTDATGTATTTTPPASRSARYRWRADRGVHSSPWLIRMVPGLTASATVGGSTTTIVPSAVGASAGDRIRVWRHLPGRTTPVRRARLDASGTASVSVQTPRRRAAYVVVLLPTRRHAGARARVVVLPPRPAAVSITGSAGRVAPGSTVVIGGTVTSATGEALPGHRVVLLRGGPARWVPVAHAVSDAAGQVSITTPPIEATTRFRLRTDHRAHSSLWRVVEQPTLTASAQREGTTTVVTASSSGAAPGDRVVLLRRVAGSLVRLRHGVLGDAGTVSFAVKARQTRTVYVVRLVATKRHGTASASAVVPRA